MLYLDLKYNFCIVVEQITSTFKYVSPRIIIDRRACACLDTSGVAYAPPDKHTPSHKKTNKKKIHQSRTEAELCAKPLAQISALSVGGYIGGLNFCVCYVIVFIFLLLERGAFLFARQVY